MAWEDRNGRQYYYRKYRVGQRVFSEYVGSGFLAELIAEEDVMKRERRRLEHQAQNHEKATIKSIDCEIDSLIDSTRTLIRACLLLAGFHPHKGQWRKRRSG